MGIVLDITSYTYTETWWWRAREGAWALGTVSHLEPSVYLSRVRVCAETSLSLSLSLSVGAVRHGNCGLGARLFERFVQVARS